MVLHPYRGTVMEAKREHRLFSMGLGQSVAPGSLVGRVAGRDLAKERRQVERRGAKAGSSRTRETRIEKRGKNSFPM